MFLKSLAFVLGISPTPQGWVFYFTPDIYILFPSSFSFFHPPFSILKLYKNLSIYFIYFIFKREITINNSSHEHEHKILFV